MSKDERIKELEDKISLLTESIDYQLTNDEFAHMIKGIIVFAKNHDWDISFGDNEKRNPTEDTDFGMIKLRMNCGCIITLGFMPNKTYHLHSIEILNKDTGIRETLFEV